MDPAPEPRFTERATIAAGTSVAQRILPLAAQVANIAQSVLSVAVNVAQSVHSLAAKVASVTEQIDPLTTTWIAST